MFEEFSLKDLACIAILLDESDRKHKQRRKWVHNMLRKRNSEGEFVTLYPELIDDEVKFYRYFRMSIAQFNDLYSKIKSSITRKNTTFREAIGPKVKLAVCLRFLATGDSYQTIAFSYRLGHSTVQSIVLEICDAIIQKLKPEVLPVPSTKDWEKIASDFWNVWNFPNCLGALDGKHVTIVSPPNSGSLYFNYKKTFSIVLLALVDANYNFIAVDIGAYGKDSDGGIFSKSNLGKAFEKQNINVPDAVELPGTLQTLPYVMVGDEAFPLKPYLLRPYPANQANTDQSKSNFNYRLSRARRVSENAFGILYQKFQIYKRKLQLNPENADRIVLTTCILHNFIRRNESNCNDNNGNCECGEISSCSTTIPRQGGNATETSFLIRDKFKDFFGSEEGRVEWVN